MRISFAAILSMALLSTCPSQTPPTMALAMIVAGPSTLQNGSSATYNVSIGTGNKPAGLNYQPTSPLWLEEQDGTLMSFTNINMPAGQTSQTVMLTLMCDSTGRLAGTANTLVGGGANNPVSSAGTTVPGMVAVRFEGHRYDGSSGWIGNILQIRCVP